VKANVDLAQLIQPGILEDPYPFFERVRAEGIGIGPHGDLIASRHPDVLTVLRNPAFGHEPVPWLPSRRLRVMFGFFLMLDPPDHTRLRNVVSPLLSSERQTQIGQRVERAARRLLDAADPTSFDVVRDFARPLALATICDELGVEDDGRTGLVDAALLLVEAIDTPFQMRASKPMPILRRVATGKMRLRRTMRAARLVIRVADRTIARPPRPDDPPTLASIRAAAANGTINTDEATATWLQLLMAGVDTTATLISNAAYALCSHPDQLDRLRQDPTLIDSAIEEVLRYESPVRMMGRVAHADVEVGGQTIRKGESAIAVMAAANRDPNVFADPDRFDITRPTRPSHVAFGQGIHFCLGAGLARLEARAALPILVSRLPEEPRPLFLRWRRLHLARGLDTLRLPLTSPATILGASPHAAEAR
jgi:hypothetical protein